jgi:hypothetical protein
MKKDLFSFYVKKNTLMRIVSERLFKSLPKRNLLGLREDWTPSFKSCLNPTILSKMGKRLELEKVRLVVSQIRRKSEN